MLNARKSASFLSFDMIDIETATAEQLYQHMRYIKDLEKRLVKMREYAAAHREELNEKAREYRRTHKETYCETQRRYRERRKLQK